MIRHTELFTYDTYTSLGVIAGWVKPAKPQETLEQKRERIKKKNDKAKNKKK